VSDAIPPAVATIDYHGSHGTTRSRSEVIQQKGFAVGRHPGRKGRGVYLWRKSRKWRELAIGWYRQAFSEGDIAGDRNAHGIVLFVKASVREDHFLDLCDPDLVDQLDELAERSGIDMNSHQGVVALYEKYVLETEAKLGHEVDMFETDIAPPKPFFCPEYSIIALGAPKCYVVRSPRILTIVNSEEFV
jgi:hypothetical protein